MRASTAVRVKSNGVPAVCPLTAPALPEPEVNVSPGSVTIKRVAAPPVVTLSLPVVAAKYVVLMLAAPDPVPPQVPAAAALLPSVSAFTVSVSPAPTLAVAEPAGAMVRMPFTAVPVAMDFAPEPEKVRWW